MSYELTIEPIGQTIEVEDDQTILDAALRAGIWLPHACCHGLCATCKVQIIDGEFVAQSKGVVIPVRSEKQRQNAEIHQVGAMDTLNALGDDNLNAHVHGADSRVLT